MASSFVGYLQGKKVDLQSLAYSMGESVIQKMMEGLLNQIIPTLANGVANIFNSMPSGWQGGAGAGVGLLDKLLGRSPSSGTSGYDYQPGGYGFLNWAKGSAFQKFGRGDIFNSPRVFPRATGYGLMAEAGPEAVMPLTRLSGGDLGVKAVGAGATPVVNVTVINNSSQVQPNVQQSSNGDLVVTIDDLAAKAYSRQGSLHKVINADRGLIRR